MHASQECAGPEFSYFYSSRRVIVGRGCVCAVPREVHRLGGQRAFVVTDPGVRGAGLVGDVTRLLEEAGIATTVFDGVQANPTVDNVLAGVNELGGTHGTVVVGVGGGSVLDAAKMIGAVAVNGGPVQQYDGTDRVPKRMLPMVAVNTTAGTGSDVTRWSVITDSERCVKMAIGDENILPDVAIDDPVLTVGLPAAVTAGTGMDALTHAIEGYVGRFRTPLSDGPALAAVELIAKYLKRAYDDGEDLEAREGLMYAQTAAGLAFQNAGVGNVHAMAHQLGALYDMPHGLSNAILLPYVMEYNLPVCQERFARLAATLGVETAGLSVEEAALAAISAVVELARSVGIPASLAATPASVHDIDTLVSQSLQDLAAGTNPRTTSEAQMRALWERAFAGHLETVGGA